MKITTTPTRAARAVLMVCAWLVLAAAAGAAEWQYVYPAPGALKLAEFSAADDAHVFAVGSGGNVVASGDGGASWEWRPTGDPMDLIGASFPDSLRGYAIGNVDGAGQVRRTDDGGFTWQTQLPPVGGELRRVAFHDADTGALVGDQGAVLWTFDGGITWLPRTTGTAVDVVALHLFDGATALIGGAGGVILRTDDAGLSWTECTGAGSLDVTCFAFDGALDGIAMGVGGAAWTDDGGLTWTRSTVSGAPVFHDAVHRGTTAMAAADGALYYSPSGGVTWVAMQSPVGDNWQAVELIADDAVLIGGSAGSIWQSDITWTAWTKTLIRMARTIRDIASLDGVTAVAGGINTILRSTDAGLTWSGIALQDADLLRLAFADTETGLAMGYGGGVWRTEDGGLSWAAVGAIPGFYVWDLICLDPSRAVAVGMDNLVRLTTDGGATWQAIPTDTHSLDNLQGVSFVDGQQGWICTWYGEILHTADGGLTWQTQLDTNLDLTAIHFLDALHGVCVGGVDGPAVLLTDDGGVTWSQNPSPDYAYLYAVRMRDRTRFLASGSGTYRSLDAGDTWQQEDPLTTLLVRDVCLLNAGVDLLAAGPAIVRAEDDVSAVAPREVPVAAAAPTVHPNPFNPRATIVFAAPQDRPLAVEVFDAAGRRLRTLASTPLGDGRHEAVWDGRDDAGRDLPSGAYLVRVDDGSGALSPARKMTLLR